MNSLAIATATLDKKGDAERMEKALSVLADYDYPVYVSDGGSCEQFISKIEGMGHYVNCCEGSLSDNHTDAILRAGENADLVLYTEPDKLEWFRKGLRESINEYEELNLEFAAIGRTAEVMRTFPEFQQLTERVINEFISHETGVTGDFVYGPKIFPDTLAYEVKEINENIGWGTLMFLVGRAYRKGLNMGIISNGVKCPLSQMSEENRNYRINQLVDNYEGFRLGLKE